MSSPVTNNEVYDLTRQSFRKLLLTQKSEPSGISDGYLNTKPFNTGHEQFTVSYTPYCVKSSRESPSQAANVLGGRIFSPSSSASPLGGRSECTRSIKVNKRAIRRMSGGSDRRRSSMVPAFGPTSYADPATSENSSFYIPAANLQPVQPSKQAFPSFPGPMLLGCSTPGTSQCQSLLPNKNRQKAVITVNADTTEILIANDNLRRLFDLNRSMDSLIGRKLADVFPSHLNKRDKYDDDVNQLELDIEEDGNNKTPLHGALFNEDGKLKPVYGKPVDIHNTCGQLSTVCLWSYPLTPVAGSNESDSNKRKTSAVLTRSPSAFLPNTKQNQNLQQSSAPIWLQSRRATQFTKKTIDNQSAEELSSLSACNCNKSPLKVLREEEQLPITLSTTQNTNNLSHAPTAFEYQDNGQKNPAEEDQTTKKHRLSKNMVLQGTSSSNDDEEDNKMGFVQRSVTHFNLGDQSPQPSPNENISGTVSSHPLQIQARETDLGNRLNVFMCGSTPVITSGIPPSLMNVNETNSSSPNDSNSSVCQHHQKLENIQCCCKVATRQNAAAHTPLNPHHDAQHLQNHMCNDAANCRWLILMNPINALHISVTLGAKGRIFRTDDSLAAILGYDCTNRLFGMEIHRLIPELRTDLDMSSKPQQCCGCSIKRNGVPFTAIVVVELDKDQNPMAFNVQLRSLSSINGVVTVTDAGIVYSYNENFLYALVGRDLDKKDEVILITDLIPGFYEASTIASLNAEQCSSPRVSESELNGLSRVEESEDTSHVRRRTESRSNSVPTIQVGAFYGLAKHRNGVYVPIRFDVTKLDMQSTPRLFAVGIGYERGIDYGFNQVMEEVKEKQVNGLTRQSSSSGAESDFETRTLKLRGGDGEELDDEIGGLQMHIQDVTLSALADESNEAICGEYSTFYDTFQLIGNGTFGSVKLAARKDSGLLAVTKFVCKDKVLPESWVRSKTRDRMIPIEVHLLETLNHPNIVMILDVFENNKYYQLVMEKLGCGMDLFEFVESHPSLDEELTSYIFRQIVNAVEYLANNGIVHRDIKDENVIIDSNFCCKLIDFGSAAYFGPNIVFSTFCGTMEYCAPEVLTGSKYLGPEVEMWSLGILLYTLVFFSNPFKTPQETVHAEFEIHRPISDGLYQVISWLLRPDPKQRAKINDIVHHWWVTQPVDPAKYRFRDVVRNSERARVSPPLYVSDLHNHLKNASSCGNLANSSMNNLEAATATEAAGIVSAR